MKKLYSARFNYLIHRYFNLFIILLTLTSTVALPQSEAHLRTPEKLVQHLYDQVTFPSGATPDWEYIKTFFIEEATIIMRMGKDSTATLSLEGWVLDFVNFIENSDIKSTGFEEKIVDTKSMVFGDIAHILVLYTSYIPEKSKAPREGVDSFHLIKKGDRWWIVSILNEIPTSYRPKPDVFGS